MFLNLRDLQSLCWTGYLMIITGITTTWALLKTTVVVPIKVNIYIIEYIRIRYLSNNSAARLLIFRHLLHPFLKKCMVTYAFYTKYNCWTRFFKIQTISRIHIIKDLIQKKYTISSHGYLLTYFNFELSSFEIRWYRVSHSKPEKVILLW